ncbi:MAG: hypothetical protein ACTHP8_09480 [Bosea sp. (in: a-proteobacteria)]|uniref:hypothetical protein n=1 Tax=Bosea sp. (in: a-proteobacteria) TaxID=1871050 RepID=UPI003F7BA43A
MLVIKATTATLNLAEGACDRISEAMLHHHHDGIFNPSGNLAFPYSIPITAPPAGSTPIIGEGGLAKRAKGPR